MMRNYKLKLDTDIYCVLTFEWYDKPKDGCPHEWEQTKNKPEWGEWTCKVCGGRGRADVWE